MANVNLGIQVIWTGDNVTANLQGVENRMEGLERAVARMGDAFDRHLRRKVLMIGNLEVGIERLSRQVGFLMRSFRNAAAVTAIVTAAIAGMAKVLLDATGKYQRFVAQLTITEGSGQGAVQALFDITRAAIDLGANIEGTIDLYSRLRLVGVEGARELSLAIAGLAATAGLTTDQIGRVTLAISQMFSKGTFVRAEEFNLQLQETLPLAARAAAEGFRRMGNEALDSVNEISSAVQAGTLRVTDFTRAIVLGSDAFVNSAAAITNARVQFDSLVQVIQLAIGAQGHMTGVTAAFGIVMNAASKAILDYIGSWEQLGPDERAQQVQGITERIVDFIAGVENAIRVVGALGRIVTGIMQAIFNSVVLAIEPVVALGMALAAIATGNFADVPRIAQAAWSAMGRTFNDIGDGIGRVIRGADQLMSRSTPIADALRDRIAQMNIPQILAEAANAPPQNPQGTNDATQRDAAAERRQRRLIELIENLQRLETDAQQVAERALSPLDAAVSRARGPIDELILRFRDLRTDFEAIAAQGTPVGNALDQIDASIRSLSDSAQEAEERASALFAAQQRIADLRNMMDISKVQNQVRELVESVTVRFESEGAEQVREAEQRLSDTRREVALQIAELDAQILQAEIANDTAEIARLSALREAHMQYQESLDGVTGRMVVAAQRMRELVNQIRSSVESSISDLIMGLMGMKEFDFDTWASDLVMNITQAIADSWAKKITDTLMGMFGLGSTQEVQTMNVGTLNAGGAGGGGGMGGGGGIDFGSVFSAVGGFFGFRRGGVPGILNGPLSGQITPFARGGIVGGPTLFGMAGEVGKEGVLPLERVGGKLGVNANMGGGDHYTIAIHAIDTQSGAQFLHDNADAIVAQLDSKRRLGSFRN